MNEVHFNFMN